MDLRNINFYSYGTIKTEVRKNVCTCPFSCMSLKNHWKDSHYIWYLGVLHCVRTFKLRLKLDENNCHFTWLSICVPAHFLSTVHLVVNQIKCSSPKQVVEPNEIYILFQIYFLCNSHGWNNFDKTPYCRSLIIWPSCFIVFKTASEVLHSWNENPETITGQRHKNCCTICTFPNLLSQKMV